MLTLAALAAALFLGAGRGWVHQLTLFFWDRPGRQNDHLLCAAAPGALPPSFRRTGKDSPTNPSKNSEVRENPWEDPFRSFRSSEEALRALRRLRSDRFDVRGGPGKTGSVGEPTLEPS